MFFTRGAKTRGHARPIAPPAARRRPPARPRVPTLAACRLPASGQPVASQLPTTGRPFDQERVPRERTTESCKPTSNRRLKAGQVTNNTLFARLKRCADVAGHARELTPGRIHVISKPDLLTHLRIVLGVVKTLSLITAAELWQRNIVEHVQAKNWVLLEQAASSSNAQGEGGDDNEILDQIGFLDVLVKYVDQGEAAASFSRAIAERAIMPFVLKATASLLGNTDCIEACSTICRALEKLEKATSSEFMEEVQALWRMCRGIAGLLSPELGMCGCTSDDVLFATTPPSDLDMEAPLDLLRLNVSEDAYFQEKSSEYSSTLLSEKSSAATLAKQIEALTSKND